MQALFLRFHYRESMLRMADYQRGMPSCVSESESVEIDAAGPQPASRLYDQSQNQQVPISARGFQPGGVEIASISS
jgi:hypothetical protein